MLISFKNFPIRIKLLLIMLLAGIPVLAAVVFLLHSKYRTDYREAEHAIQATAEAIAAQHEAHINGIHTLLITLSQFPEVKSKNPEACRQLLKAILRKNPTSHNIGIADTDGRLIASGINAKFSIGDRKYFKDALRTKRFSVGEYTISRAVAKPAIHFALPVLDNAGQVKVVIYATFDLAHFNRIFDAQKLPDNSALNITDHRGILLHRYPDHPTVRPGLEDRPDLRQHMTGSASEGVFRDIGRDGIRRILAFKRLQLYPDDPPYMYIRVSIPESEAFVSINRELTIAVCLFVIASLIALWCSHFFSGRFLVTPLERLAAVADSASQGDFSVRSGVEHSQDEIGLLAHAFDSMTESLETRSREKEEAEKERILLERQLLHAQKLESLGVLAGGIAHDFNNILTTIIGNADLAMMRIPKESPLSGNLQNIEKAAARAADLAMQMLAYSGKGKFVVEVLNMNLLLQEILHMLQVSISKKVHLQIELASDLPPVKADATQIRQIIMNLVINASEAIGDQTGTITISTGCMACDREYLKNGWQSEEIPEGLYVFLEVCDTGCGMDQETLSRIFDPFFTTKFTGRGLGMAAVLGIVRGHRGAIGIYSEPGKGTTFKILFPASGRPADVFRQEEAPDNWQGSGTVLLVDDEESIRDIGRDMLQELGYSTVTASDGKEALSLFERIPEIDFVILDLTMPRMDGEQCFQELRRIRPGIKVIISSGFSEQEVGRKFMGSGIAGFIQKPYRMAAMQEVIRRMDISVGVGP